MAFWLVKWDAVLIKLHFYVRQMEITYAMMGAAPQRIAIISFSNRKWVTATSNGGLMREKKKPREARIRNRSITNWSIHRDAQIRIHIDMMLSNAKQNKKKRTYKTHFRMVYICMRLLLWWSKRNMCKRHSRSYENEKSDAKRVAKQSELMKCGSLRITFHQSFSIKFVSPSGWINGIWSYVLVPFRYFCCHKIF